jgi:hypothetical protein
MGICDYRRGRRLALLRRRTAAHPPRRARPATWRSGPNARRRDCARGAQVYTDGEVPHPLVLDPGPSRSWGAAGSRKVQTGGVLPQPRVLVGAGPLASAPQPGPQVGPMTAASPRCVPQGAQTFKAGWTSSDDRDVTPIRRRSAISEARAASSTAPATSRRVDGAAPSLPDRTDRVTP